MRKFFAAGLLAVCLVAASQQRAQAWVNFKFGVGMNLHYQSGNNCFLWGLWNNGQVPGPEYFQGQGAGFDHGHGHGHPLMFGVGLGMGHHGHAAAPYASPYYHAGTGQASPYQLMSYPGQGYYYPNYYSTGWYGY